MFYKIMTIAIQMKWMRDNFKLAPKVMEHLHKETMKFIVFMDSHPDLFAAVKKVLVYKYKFENANDEYARIASTRLPAKWEKQTMDRCMNKLLSAYSQNRRNKVCMICIIHHVSCFNNNMFIMLL